MLHRNNAMVKRFPRSALPDRATRSMPTVVVRGCARATGWAKGHA